jgi:hypothetical protein
MFRVVSDGTELGTVVLDARTGEDITKRLGASSVSMTVSTEHISPRVDIQIAMSCEMDIHGEPRWFAMDPQTEEMKELRALEFSDGTRVILLETFGRKNAGAA